MNEILPSASRLALLAFLLTSMTEVGLSLRPHQIIAPLRRARFVLVALAVNFILVPLMALGIGRVFRLEEPFVIGLLLLGLAPGAPFLPKLVELAKGDLGLAVGLMVLLMVTSVVYLPVVLPQLVPDVKVSIWRIARPLVFLMFLPLLVGLTIRARSDSFAACLRVWLGRVSNASLVVVSVLVVTLNLPSVLKVFGSGAITAALLFSILAGLTGYFLAGPEISVRKVMGLGSGFRNLAAALVVAEEDFADPKVTVMVVIAALLGLLLFLPLTLTWRNTQSLLLP